MKRILFSLLIPCMVLACSAKDYTLNGKIEDNTLEGVTMNLQTHNGKEWVDVGNQVVTNKQFKFTGVAEQPTMALLSFSDKEKGLRGSKLFILENGKTNFFFDKEQNVNMEGTKQNNLIQSFEDEMDNATPKSTVDSIQNNLYSQEEASKKIEEIVGTQKRIIVDFAKKNVNTLAGTTIFLNTVGSLDFADKLAVLDMMDNKTKQNPLIQSIASQVEKEKRVAVGQPYTNFTLPDTNGNPFSLSQLIGQSNYVLIDFWASWCGPCLRSFPDLTAFYNESEREKIEIIGVSLDRDGQSWKSAIEKHGLVWKHVSDLKFWQSEAAQLYGVGSIPHTILIDKDGKIVGHNLSLTRIKEIISGK